MNKEAKKLKQELSKWLQKWDIDKETHDHLLEWIDFLIDYEKTICLENEQNHMNKYV